MLSCARPATSSQRRRGDPTAGGCVSVKAYARLVNQVRPCRALGVARLFVGREGSLGHRDKWKDGERRTSALEILGVDLERTTVITRDLVQYAKPNPDLFIAAADKLGVHIGSSVVVGDSVWDLLAARRAAALGIGLLCRRLRQG